MVTDSELIYIKWRIVSYQPHHTGIRWYKWALWDSAILTKQGPLRPSGFFKAPLMLWGLWAAIGAVMILALFMHACVCEVMGFTEGCSRKAECGWDYILPESPGSLQNTKGITKRSTGMIACDTTVPIPTNHNKDLFYVVTCPQNQRNYMKEVSHDPTFRSTVAFAHCWVPAGSTCTNFKTSLCLHQKNIF